MFCLEEDEEMPQQEQGRKIGGMFQYDSAVGGAYHLQHDENIGGGQYHLRGNGMRRVSDASSNGSFENMSRPAYTGRDTDRFFGGEFELDDEAPPTNGVYDEDFEDEDEPVSELVPIGGGTRRVPRTPRSKSTSKCGFYDFFKLTDDHLGSGAYGSVKTCTALSTGMEYAVKIVSKDGERHTRQRILQEVKIFKVLRNQPQIVQLIEWFEDDENYYLVMEKMLGGPLLQQILERGYFTEEQARRVTKDIALGLKGMHDRGIAHRDVKPENVLCTDPHQVSPVKLCDLDLASQRQPSDRHEYQMREVASEPDFASPVGSAEFMAPEVVDAFVGDSLKYDKKCDTWSLGVILYIMLAGYAPFQGECDDENCGWCEGQPCDNCQQELFHRIQSGQYDFPEEEWRMISDEAKDLVSNLLKRDPIERFSADDVLKHQWIQQQSAPSTILQTPSNLIHRKDSVRDVQQMTEHFNVMHRMTAARLSARMDQLNLDDAAQMENGGAIVTIHDPTFLSVGGEGFGGSYNRMNSSARTITSARNIDFTPPVSRASPTTPPPSTEMFNDSGSYSVYSPNQHTTPLKPLYFGMATDEKDESFQLFGGGETNGVGLNSVQMTPRLTTEDDSSLGSASPPQNDNQDNMGKPIRCLEAKVEV